MRDMVVFPLPDSPTIPSRMPRSRLKLTLRTAGYPGDLSWMLGVAEPAPQPRRHADPAAGVEGLAKALNVEQRSNAFQCRTVAGRAGDWPGEEGGPLTRRQQVDECPADARGRRNQPLRIGNARTFQNVRGRSRFDQLTVAHDGDTPAIASGRAPHRA